MPRLSDSDIRVLRACIRPDCARLPSRDLEALVNGAISELPDGTTEDFLSTLSSVGKVAVPLLKQAAPAVAQGAASGATLGPWGALIGAGAGLASSLIKGQSKPATPSPPAAPAASPTAASSTRTAAPSTPAPTVSRIAPQTIVSPPATTSPASATAAPAAPVASPAPSLSLPSGQEAAATVLSLLQNQTVLLSLLSQALGSSGAQFVPSPSGASLPRGAINTLLIQLLCNASDGLPESDSISEQRYLRDATGEYMVDPASVDQLGALVLRHVQPGDSARPRQQANRDSFDWFDAESSYESVAFF